MTPVRNDAWAVRPRCWRRAFLSGGIASAALAGAMGAQQATGPMIPVIAYTLRVDSADASAFSVEMAVRSAPDSFRLAMVRHPEYDDRFWRYMSDLTVRTPSGAGRSVRLDSALWAINAPGGEATISWRVSVPAEGAVRASWRPFIAPTGALVGGPHSFLYMVGSERAPARVTLELPAGWTIATGLTPTNDPRRFRARDVATLVDSPILTGDLRSWWFAIDDVPHRIAYWPLPGATPFDTAQFVRAVSGVAREAIALFGGAPYDDYTFLFRDGAYGGLEHASSVSLGAESKRLSEGMADAISETAHEYLHAWNLVRIRPRGRGEMVTWLPNGRTRGLWFSEGVTMFYADALARRAGAPVSDSTRVQHVEELLGQYFGNPGSTAIDPERASLAEYGGTVGELGDYAPSPHAQGEVIGTMLDLLIREATNDRRSMDDVMRLMMQRFSGDSSFTTASVERAVSDVCACNAAPFFARSVRGAGGVDVDRYLRAIGLHAAVSAVPATNADGSPRAELRIFAVRESPGEPMRLRITDPASSWARAGLHTGDELVAVNGQAMDDTRAFRAALFALHVGDTARVAVLRNGRRVIATVPVRGYDRVVVRLLELPDATERQRARRERWLTGR